VPKLLDIAHFGNPVLREVARHLTAEEIKSTEIQDLIADIRYTNKMKPFGVGLAAPQVGVSVALSVIGIKPTPNRPNLEPFDSVIINPSYEGVGQTEGMWEACQSGGSGEGGGLYAQAERYKTIRAQWYDSDAVWHDEELSGFVAHVFQHEADHVNGVLFVDKVSDTKTYMTYDEYRERIAGAKK